MNKRPVYYLVSCMLFILISVFLTVQLDTAKAEPPNSDILLPLVLKDYRFTDLINFDDMQAPCVFLDTVALREEYASQGVVFTGTQPLYGGGILNECGNFGVTGYSPPNFLAFNITSFYSDSGIPTPPQTIIFNPSVTSVTLSAGSMLIGEQLSMRAYDSNDALLGEVTISLSNVMQKLTVTSPRIRYVVIDANAEHFVIDDLLWTTE